MKHWKVFDMGIRHKWSIRLKWMRKTGTKKMSYTSFALYRRNEFLHDGFLSVVSDLSAGKEREVFYE
mgnify:CR=1 FL=1